MSSSPANSRRPAPTAGAPLVDEAFELLEERPQGTVNQGDSRGDIWWIAALDDSDPQGPVSSAELRKRIASGEIRRTDTVWRDGLTQWEPVTAYFKLPPPLVPANHHRTTNPRTPIGAGLHRLIFAIGHWMPSPFAVRVLGRTILLSGAVMILFSFPLSLFGWSWFSGGFQLVLIASVLELTAISLDVRATTVLSPAEPNPIPKDMSR